MSNILVWTDIETFGLDPAVHPVLEIGFQITDLELNTLAKNNWLFWVNGIYDTAFKKCKNDSDQFVYKTHTKNNLFDEARSLGGYPYSVEETIIDWLEQQKVPKGSQPLCGSSVHFDRSFLKEQFPQINNYFHYRIIDNSTLKELCRRYNKRLYENLPQKTETHRVLPDLEETIQEFKFYRDEFLLW